MSWSRHRAGSAAETRPECWMRFAPAMTLRRGGYAGITTVLIRVHSSME